MRSLRLSLFLCALWCATGFDAWADSADGATATTSGENYVVDFWRTEQGLPHNTVNALLQTRDGYLWVGTASGLARFDGLAFTLIGNETIPGFEGARITALLEDRQGGLWVGTQEKGVVRLGNKAVQILGKADGLLDNMVTSLAEDSDGVIWIGTHGGLNRWEQGRLESFTSDTLRPGEPIAALHAGRSGVLWITTRFEVYRLHDGRVEPFRFEDMPQGRNADFVGVYEDHKGNLWTYGATFLLNLSQGKRINYFRSLDPASSRVWTICEQGDGAFWIGTSGRGLFQFHEGRFEIVGARDGLDQCDIRALHADREGNLWIGTSGSGLARLRRQQWRLFGSADGLNSTRLTALALDGQKRLVVGTANAGLTLLDGQRFESFVCGPPLAYATDIRSLCTDRHHALWVGTWGAGLFRVLNGRQWHYTTEDGLKDDVILALAAERQSDAVWAGTLSGGLHRITPTNVTTVTPASGEIDRPIVCLTIASNNDLWIGLDEGGLLRWDGRQTRRVPTPTALRNKTILCLFEDVAGRQWAGTMGAGAFCQVGGSWVAVGKRQGLASDTIRQILQDKSGDYWFNTDRGLSQVHALDMENCLRGNRTVLPAIVRRREEGKESMRDAPGWARAIRKADGSLWFAANSGLLTVNPAHAPAASPPRVRIEKVLVDKEPVLSSILGDHTEELRLGPGVSSLDFLFTAISFTAPEQTRFRHMLEGYETDWVQSDTSRREHYGPLPPGHYRFRVIAANADGIWNEVGDSVALVVVPPFWRATWFMVVCGVAGVAALWAVVRYITFRRLRARLRVSEQRRAMERERSRIAQDMHDEIGSKLTRISFLSEAARYAVEGGNRAAPQVEAIASTSRELLQALDEIVWAVNPRNDNLEHLAGYLEQYAREYFHGTRLECTIAVPDRLPAISLSAELRHNVFLAFEEALSNALQHSGAGRVRIQMVVQSDLFEIIVEDNGVGFEGPAPQLSLPGHDGLENMRDRLRAVGGICLITSTSGRGTTIRLKFPLNGVTRSSLTRHAASL